MKLRQISVFLSNEKGRLAEACSLLGDHGINIRALTIAETRDFGVLRIIVDKPDEAATLLRDNGFVAKSMDVVAVEVADKPGGLAAILKILDQNGINVEYMYGFVEKFSDNALMVLRFDDADEAIRVLQSHKVKIVKTDQISAL